MEIMIDWKNKKKKQMKKKYYIFPKLRSSLSHAWVLSKVLALTGFLKIE